jgi:catechol 2,3-dioxygenase-like lactoylglutathione lyase family enzyme
MPDLSLDHVIIGVADLAAASASLTTVLGRTPSWRGRHPSYGTANVLYRLETAYLELLAPDPDATTTTAWTGSLGRFLNERGEGLFSVALQTTDVQATAAAARRAWPAGRGPGRGRRP